MKSLNQAPLKLPSLAHELCQPFALLPDIAQTYLGNIETTMVKPKMTFA